MTSDLERRYRRSLRAYPAAWRAENAEIVLGTLLDVADAEGRDRPAPGERLSLGIDGAAHRLDRSVATGAAFAAFAASTIGAALMLFFAAPMAELGLWWVALVLQIVVTIVAAVAATAALLRSTHRIGSRSALWAVALSLPSAGAAFVAVTLWAIAFDAADAGRPVSATQDGLMIGCLIGSVVLGSVVVGLLSRPLFPAGVSSTIGGAIAAVVATPIVGYALASPLTGIVLSGGIGVIAIATGPNRGVSGGTPALAPSGSAPGDASAPAQGGGSVRSRPRAGVVPALASATAAGLAAVVVSLTGSMWIPALDATQTMNLGLGLGGLTASMTVAVLASGLVRSGKLPVPGAVAAVLAPAVGGAGQLVSGLLAVDPWPAVLAGSSLAGLALAFLVGRMFRRAYPRLAAPAVVAIAVLAGAGYAAMPGIMVAASAPFIAPLVAGIAAWSLLRRRRPSAPAPAVFAPSI